MIWEVIVSDDYLIFGNIRQKYFIFDQHAAQKILKDNSIIDRISSSVHNSDPTAELFLYCVLRSLLDIELMLNVDIQAFRYEVMSTK